MGENYRGEETEVYATVSLSEMSNCFYSTEFKTIKYEAQTALFKDTVRTAQ
jgi:hypothetical protein